MFSVKKEQIDSKNGNYNIAISDRYNYSRLNTNSVAFRMLAAIYANPLSTRKEIQGFIYDKKVYPAYGSTIWRNLLADELIFKVRKNKNVYYVLGDKGHRIMCEVFKKNFKIK
jgi:hypothetical protein